MAGESPGRAEQQESSGEATGGGAVDPRLTVFHGVVGAPRGAAEPVSGEPESVPEPPEGTDAPTPEPSASDTPDEGADADGGARDATPDAGDATGAGGARGGAESRTDDVVAEEAGAPLEGREAAAGTAEGAEPKAEPEPEQKPEGGRSAKEAGPGDADEQTPADGPEAPQEDAPAADDARPQAEQDAPADTAGQSRDETPREGSGPDGAEGPSQGPGGVKGGSGAREASGGGHDAPRAGEGTLTLRAPGAEGAGTPVRDSGTLTLRAPVAAAPAPSASAPSASVPAASVPAASVPPASAPSAPAPAASPPRPSGTFVPLRTDDRPPAIPQPQQPPQPAGTAPPQATEPGGGSRTKQMPLPPDPDEPLRLLAELTNTPPPPQTPLRTTVRRIKIWTPLVLLLVAVFCVAQALRPLPEPELRATAASSYTFEGGKLSLPWPSEGQAVVEAEGLGRVGAFGEQKPTPIASVAKVMTTYVILRDHPIKKGGKGETVEVDQKAEDQYHSGLAASESVVPVTEGQELTEYEALEAVMLPSANNIARLLARWDAGSEAAFVEKMNAAARELGMDDTTYTDPSGLEATTVSTASDQVKLGHAAMQDPVFAEIAGKIQYTDINGGVQKNYNQLAGYNGIVGIKTGTSTKAGGNLLFAAYRTIGGTRQLIVGAMLDQQKAPIIDTVLSRSRTLIDGTRDALASATIIKKGDVVGYVDDGLGGRTPVVAGKDVTAIGWAGLKVAISVEALKGGVPHTAQAGARVGTLVVGSGDGATTVPVLLETALVEPSLGSKLTRVS
ncbi:D-alanyl-D-alanine carboxypeptidase [Actinacidiphila sp. bgisy167]|uniref:D-alanyl-D-alanine carboxypeptidase n=1 Tax=Actinacidiphila sp. bgisy167 TaxID=3413797 RepID=UPI003D732AC2